MAWNNGSYRDNRFTQQELQLSNMLRRLWFEHVMWTRAFIVSTAFNLADLNYVTERLLRNPVDFADLFGQVYGSQKAARLEELLTNHLLIAAQLVNAAKAGDAVSVTQQRNMWYANANEIANFLSEINPYWNLRQWQQMLSSHLQMTENEAVQILTQQYAASINEFDKIAEQAMAMADVMTNGIINQSM
jgi:hypothetical protein